MGLTKTVRLRCLRVFVDQPVEDRAASDGGGGQFGAGGTRRGRPLAQRAMGAMFVVMPRVLGEDPPEVSFTVDQQVVEALAS